MCNRFNSKSYYLSTLFHANFIYIHRYANWSAHFIAVYREGLSSTQATWANRKYHGHHILPPEMVAMLKENTL